MDLKDVIITQLSKEIKERIYKGSITLQIFENKINWEELFDELLIKERSDYDKKLEIFISIVKEIVFDKMYRPNISSLIAKSLGAKKVTIEW